MYTFSLFCTIVNTILGFRLISEHRPNLKVQPECKISAHSRNELYSINITSLLWACNYRLCHKVLNLVERTLCYKLHWLHFRFCILCLLLCDVRGATSYAFRAEQHQVRLMLLCRQNRYSCVFGRIQVAVHCSMIMQQSAVEEQYPVVFFSSYHLQCKAS